MRIIISFCCALIASPAFAAQPYQLSGVTLAANAQPVIREADGAYIPNDARNMDYQRLMAWLAAGNTPDSAPDAPPAPITSMQNRR